MLRSSKNQRETNILLLQSLQRVAVQVHILGMIPHKGLGNEKRIYESNEETKAGSETFYFF